MQPATLHSLDMFFTFCTYENRLKAFCDTNLATRYSVPMDECQSSQIHKFMTRLKIINGDEKISLALM